MRHIFLYRFGVRVAKHSHVSHVVRQFVVLLLISGFLIPPSSTILAQEAPQEIAEEPISSTSTPTEGFSENTLAESSSESDIEGGGEDPPMSLLDDETIDPPTISNPNLFTSQSKAPNVDTSGALVHRVPFDIPPGRNGLTPDLALVYNSQQLDDGIVGYGWSLSIPYIERINKTGVERLYLDNNFTSSLGGELATTSTTNEYRHRFDDGSFTTYTFSGNSWVAYDKKGTKYTFGATTTAQLYATTTPSNVYRWMLEEIRDTNNNYITYQYMRDNNTNQLYPYRILYTGNNTTDGIFTVSFATSTRTDPITSYKTGFKIVTTHRISEISASVNGSWVRKFALGYTLGQNSARSLLSSVQETGRDDSLTELTLPALSFTYSSTTPGYTDHANKTVWNAARVIADSDGNGLPDLNIFYENYPSLSHDRYIEENEYPSFTTHSGTPASTEYWANDGSSWDDAYLYEERGTRFFDASGDGKADIVRGLNVSGGTLARSYSKNTSGLEWTNDATATTTIPMFAYQDSGGARYSSGLLGNVNGDGLVDYVISLPSLGSNMATDGTYLHQSTSTALWTLATSTFTPVAEMPTTGASQVANELVDINGDGLDDWVTADSGSISFCLNTGNSWSTCNSAWNIATSSRHANGWDRGIRFLDYNGDGLVDYVRGYYMPSYLTNSVSHIEVGTYNYVYLNTGSGWATTSLQLPETIFQGNLSVSKWTGRIKYNEMVDWNGDGIPDGSGVTSTTTKPDLLKKITYPTGGNTEIGYIFSSQTLLNPDLAFPMLLAASTTVSDNLGTSEQTLYRYEGGKMYLDGDIKDRRFSGFNIITETHPLGTTKTYYHQGDTAASTTGELSDSFALLAKPFREDIISAASTTLKRSYYRWDTASLGATTTSTNGNTHSVDLERGSTQYASISDGSQTGLDFSNNLTFAQWIMIETVDTSGANPLVIKRVASGNQRSYSLYFNGNANQLNFDSQYDGLNASCSVNVSWTPSTGTWYHVAVTKSGTSLKFYVNGSQLGSTQTCASSTIYNGTAPVEIGGWANGPSYLDGLIDDTRLWARELSSTEISDLYSTPGSFSNGSDLKASWQFNNTYTDDSGNSNTLTAQNSPVFSSTVPYEDATSSTTPPNAYFSYIAKEMTQDWEGGSAHKDRATEYAYSTTTGNLTQKIERGEVVGATDGTYADTNSDARFTDYTYAASTSANLFALVSEVVKNNASTTVKESRFTYDNLSFGSVGAGNRTKDEMWISGSIYASTTKAYNAYGLVTTSTDPRGATTTYTYDTFNIYPATTTNALGHETGILYDYAKGAAKRITDSNGLVRTTTFDPVGRVTEEKQPDITTPSTLVTSKTYTYTDTFPNNVLVRSYLTSATTSDQYSYKDGLGRTIQERAQTGGNNTYSVKDYVFGTNGMLVQESLPYFSSSTARTTATSTSALFVTYAHDGLKRVATTTNAIGSITYAYSPWKTIVTDLNAISKHLYRDAYDNLSTVVEFNDNGVVVEVATTTYVYNSLQNLTSITDALANVRNFTYDGLSRRLTAQDLHDTGDGTFGTWNYAYDLANNIASTSDPLGQVINFTYDSLNRVTTEDYTGAAGSEVSYLYDFCAYGKGRLCVASSTSAYTNTAYNALGLVSGESKRISGTAYATTSFAYDRQGNTSDITYPDNRTVHYGYDAWNHIADISSRASGGSSSSILTKNEYAPTGQISNRVYGNSVEIPYVYNANLLYRLTRIGNTSGGIQSLAYIYDENGNITGITDASNTASNHSVDFIYDDLNRLLSASTTAATSTNFKEIYRYNMLGNLLYKGIGISATTTGGSNTHSLDLEGSSSQYASISDASQTGLDLSNNLTASAWVKFESLNTGGNANPFVIKRVATGNQRSYSFYANPSSSFLDLDTQYDGFNASCSVSVSWTPSTATWYHVAVTKSGTSVKFYVDGSQQGSTQTCTSSTIYNGTAPVEIGGWAAGPVYHDGLIDDVRVWARELSSTEISDLYTSPGTFSNGSDLKGSWQFNNAYTDGSGNSNTLTAQNSPVFSSLVPYSAASNQPEGDNYAYAETDYANPHAPTGIYTNGATTTYAYDANGNLTGTTGAATSTYIWDYRNRMTQASTTGSISTYAYDHTTARMRQTVGSTITDYPSKFYSFATSTATGTGTSTSYIWHGDTLVAYIEQRLVGGVASGTPTTYFVHPDHLGSTNIVTSATGTVVLAKSYMPYGSPRVESGNNSLGRGFIAQFEDENLLYLQARYMDPGRGQFIGQDPVFWEVGQTQAGKVLQQNPQLSNSYSYAAGNPIIGKDADGRLVELVSRPLDISGGGMFGHAFLKITPTNPGTIGTVRDKDFQTGNLRNIDSGSTFTLSGYTDGDVLFKEANAGPDYSRISNCTGCASVAVAPPNGVSAEDFERNIVSGFNGLPEVLSGSYGRTGQVRITGSPNSNNAATTYLMQAGISGQQINKYQSTLYSGNNVFVPGLGQSAFAPTYSQAARAQIGSLLNQLSGVLTQLSAAISNKK